MSDTFENILASKTCPRCDTTDYYKGYCAKCSFWARGNKKHKGRVSFSTNIYKIAIDLNKNTSMILNFKDRYGGPWEFSRYEAVLNKVIDFKSTEECIIKFLILK